MAFYTAVCNVNCIGVSNFSMEFSKNSSLFSFNRKKNKCREKKGET